MKTIVFTLFLLVLLSSIWVSLGSESNIIIEWLGYHVEVSTIFATILFLITLIVAFLVIYFLIFLRNIPSSLKKHYQEKQDQEDLILLLKSFSSLYDEDLSKMKQLIKKVNSSRNHSQMELLKPFVSLFVTQANHLQYKADSSFIEALEDSYQESLQHESTKFIGLKGLVTLRIEKKCYHDALVYAEKAYAIQPKSAWLLKVLIEIYTELDLYDKVDQIINKALGYKFIDKKEANSLLVTNFLKSANHLIADSEAEKAILLLEKALKIDPSYYDALVILVRLYVQDNNKKLAYKIIEKAWKNKASIAIANLMLKVSKDEVLNKRVQLLENLIDSKPEHKEGYLALTQVYIEEAMLTEARSTMDKLLSLHAPDSDTSKLMALIEAKAHNNHSVIINWLYRI